jgi:hypothetical protein
MSFDKYMSTISGYVGYQGNPPTTEAEYEALAWANIVTEEDGTRVITGYDGTWEDKPTWAEIQAGIAAYVDPAAAGFQKLLDLGLTQEEATALTGYAPPSE